MIFKIVSVTPINYGYTDNSIQDKNNGRPYPYYDKASQKDWKYDSE